jgi:predicted nucleotidyltransferase
VGNRCGMVDSVIADRHSRGLADVTTMLDLAPADLERYRDAARRRAASRELASSDVAARDDLLKRVRNAAAILRTRYGVKRVILFGSLAHEAWYSADSDVDLAVEGLPSDVYWRAWRAIEEIIGDRSVDLVEVETAGESLRSAIERHGVPL